MEACDWKVYSGKDRVCGVIAAETAREMKSQIRLALRTTRTLELRLDYLRDAKERAAFLTLAWPASGLAPC